jgi:2-polyprenyl-6-methoxyphenol hydroxylase-like FAD-dependent oxidoreductase
LKQLAAIGVTIEYNHRAVKYDEHGDKGIVEFENGARVEADVVVAADGIGSKSFEVVTRDQVRARSSGYAIYRTAYPVEFATADSDVDSKFALLTDNQSHAQMWVG